MEDMATGEIRLSILWEWVHKGAKLTEDDPETGVKAGDTFTVFLFKQLLTEEYAKEPFVYVLPFGKMPHSRHVRGSNMTFIGVVQDRIEGRAIIISTLDNLTKGASGQAVQNMNAMLGFAETLGLDQAPMFP